MRNADDHVTQMVRGVLTELQEAFATRDLDRLAQLHDAGPGLTVMAAGPGEVARGVEQVRAFYDRNFRRFSRGTLALTHVTVMQPTGCDTVAWVVADARFDLWIDNQQRQITGPYAAIIEHQENRWHIVQAQFAVPLERTDLPTQLWQHEGEIERRGEAA